MSSNIMHHWSKVTASWISIQMYYYNILWLIITDTLLGYTLHSYYKISKVTIWGWAVQSSVPDCVICAYGPKVQVLYKQVSQILISEYCPDFSPQMSGNYVPRFPVFLPELQKVGILVYRILDISGRKFRHFQIHEANVSKFGIKRLQNR